MGTAGVESRFDKTIIRKHEIVKSLTRNYHFGWPVECHSMFKTHTQQDGLVIQASQIYFYFFSLLIIVLFCLCDFVCKISSHLLSIILFLHKQDVLFLFVSILFCLLLFLLQYIYYLYYYFGFCCMFLCCQHWVQLKSLLMSESHIKRELVFKHPMPG